EIPDSTTCLIEVVPHDTGMAYYIHTPLNRAANDALARVAVYRLARTFNKSSTSVVADLGFALILRSGPELSPEDLRSLLSLELSDNDLAKALDGSPALRQRFERVAQTGLMVLRNPLGPRRKVGGKHWTERRLFDQVRAVEPDFVLLRQAE